MARTRPGAKTGIVFWLFALLLVAGAIPAAAGPKPQTNTTLGIRAIPGILNARTASEATSICGPGTETGVPDNQAALSFVTPNGGVDGSAGYYLEKKVPTAKCAVAGIDFDGEDGIVLNRLGFDVSGYCGAGAPRFNLELVDGDSFFIGCAGMDTVGTFTDSTGTTWTTKRADLAGLGIENEEIATLEIIQDEQGATTLDNIAISNATLKGDVPTKKKNKCADKKGEKKKKCRKRNRR